MKFSHLLVVVLSFLSLNSIAQNKADDKLNPKIQKELKRFYRCHSHMVRERPKESDGLVQSISRGEISGTEACMSLLNIANLDSESGLLSGAIDDEVGVDSQVNLEEEIYFHTFKETLHQTLRGNKCVNCHAANNPTPHTHADHRTGASAIQNRSLVSFDNPSISKIYTKIMNGHKCSGNECDTISSSILSSVQAWKSTFVSTDRDQFAEDNGLTSNGNSLPTQSYNDKAQKILTTFNDFHRSWMGVNEDYNIVLGCTVETHDVMDSGMFGYYVTRALFTEKGYDDVVTSDDYLRAVRVDDLPRSPRLRAQPRRSIASMRYGVARDMDGKVDHKNGTIPEWADRPNVVDLGKLVGIKVQPPAIMSAELINKSNDVDLFKTDAGIIDSPPYRILNNGLMTKVADGGLKVQRRWARAVFNDVLCRDLPVVRSIDALPYVDKTGTSSLPFRGGISCMKCHSSMDQMARVSRNTQLSHTSGYDRCPNSESMMIHRHKPEVHADDHPNEWEGWIDEPDSQFYKRRANGRLYFRGHDGELHDYPLTGMDQLGATIAKTEDYYVCAAKRYVHFFTGVDVPLFDPGDLNSPALNSKEQEYLDFVKSLGKELKEHRDLKKTIRRIIASEAYMSPGKKVE